MQLCKIVPLLAAGCFADPKPGAGEGGTGAEVCSPGELACECADGDLCLGELACEPSIKLCIDPNCTPGSVSCTCADGACLQGLVCGEGLCRPPGGSDDSGSGGVVTSGASMSTTMTATSGLSMTSGDDLLTGVADTGLPLTTGIADTGVLDTGGPGCDVGTCEDCFGCVIKTGGVCETAAMLCGGAPDCMSRRECSQACEEQACADECCNDGQRGNPTWDTLATCVDQACSSCSVDHNCLP